MRTRRLNRWIACAQIVCVVVFILPMVWLYVAAFRTNSDLVGFLPRSLTFENFAAILRRDLFWRSLVNSLIVSSVTALVSVLLGSLCAYALERMRFRWRGFVNVLVSVGLVTPVLVILLPLVVIFRDLRMADKLPSLVIVNVLLTMPICILLLRNSVRSIPIEVEEAARVDGAGLFSGFWYVILPLLRQGMVTAGVFAFILSWGEYLMALSLISSDSQKTLPLALQTLFDRNTTAWSQVMAFGVLITLPVIILFVRFQRQLVSNLFGGAVK